MKGKAEFTVEEAVQIENLIEHKLRATSNEQKGIREKIRKLGFHAADFGVRGGFTVADFKRVVRIVGVKPFAQAKPTVQVKLKVPSKAIKPSIATDLISLDHSQEIVLQLKALGFKGFLPIKDIRQDYSILPKEKGIYILLRVVSSYTFVEVGTGGFFKGKNPNVCIIKLQSNWVDDTPIVYIGKAGGSKLKATLHSRIKQYFRFGEGKVVGHWGGRYIWQLEGVANLIVCWKEILSSEPAEVETQLIKEFTRFYGKRPFANLKD
ncbi:hypothetical protein [Sphingobacterium bovisgrunnientis]|uniref:hypothetical protein n=1 Tax=Sphingobacterium bovisgrunnientis TaxID=1874697 RepID=UPI0019590FB8|nr:hypothetical protein [Sphingobacterium bovisgrunnientis]